MSSIKLKNDSHDIELSTFKGRLLWILKREGLSQADLAKKCDITERTISRWMTGKNPPDLKSLQKISTETGYSLRFLRDDDYEGPALAVAVWAYNASQLSMTNQDVARIYQRLEELMEAKGLNQAQLLAESNITRDATDDSYFLGFPPNPRDIEKIANTTGYSKDWLWRCVGSRLTNRKPSGGQLSVDIELLTKVIAGVEKYLKKAEDELEPPKKARLIALLYERFVKTGEEPNQDTIVSYLKLAA